MMKEDYSEDLKGKRYDNTFEPASSHMKNNTKASLGEKAAKAILEMTKEDLGREGILKTPARFSKAYRHLFSGYDNSPSEAIGEGIFDSEGSGLVNVEAVEFYSMCEHHLLPFWGKAKVMYFPDKKILGLSKIPRLVNLFSRRIQVQERITEQLVTAIQDLIHPRAIAVQLEAQHLCMMMRGVEKQGSATRTEKIVGFENLHLHEQQQFMNMLTGR